MISNLNAFHRLRESSRDELFEKAKGEILDEVVNLSQVSAKDWEHLLYNKLWEKLSTYCFENIYLAAANSNSAGKHRLIVISDLIQKNKKKNILKTDLIFLIQVHSTQWLI